MTIVSCNGGETRTFPVINIETNELIEDVIWANDKTGRYRVISPDDDGNIVEHYKKRGKSGFRIRSKVLYGRIKILK